MRQVAGHALVAFAAAALGASVAIAFERVQPEATPTACYCATREQAQRIEERLANLQILVEGEIVEDIDGPGSGHE